jgi:outer membrane immunogenic protein
MNSNDPLSHGSSKDILTPQNRATAMRHLSATVIAAISVTAFTQIASAADLLGVPPAAVASWSGCYVGLNAGGAWGDAEIKSSATGIDADAGYNTTLRSAGSPTLHSESFTGGGQIGCNYQVSQFVLGVEGDFGYLGFDGSRNTGPNVAPVGTTITFSEDVHANWIGTVRGRLGYLVAPNWLIYGTGGAGFTDESFRQNLVFGPAITRLPGKTTDSRTGWIAGGGVEWAFMPKWSAKLEYLFVDFGTLSFSNATPNASVYRHSSDLTDNIVRVGINYKVW